MPRRPGPAPWGSGGRRATFGMLSRLIRCSASTQWHRGAPRGPATLRALPPLPHEDPLQGPSSKLGLPGPRLPQPCRGGSLLSTGEGRERLFPRMPPTGSHSGILAPAMLSRGPKDYLKPAQRASGAGGPSRAAPAQSSRGPKGVPPWPIRAGSPVSGVRTGQSEGRKMSFPCRTLPCSLGTQIPSVRVQPGGWVEKLPSRQLFLSARVYLSNIL